MNLKTIDNSLQVFHTSSNWWFFIHVLETAISRSFLRMLVVVWMVLILPLISCSSSVFSSFLRNLSMVATTIGITVTFIFHNLYCSQARSRYMSVFSLTFIFNLWSAWMAKSMSWSILFFLLSGCLAGIGWAIFLWLRLNNPFTSQKSQRIFMYLISLDR